MTPIETSFDRPELAMKVLSNIHPWMCAYVFGFSHPYFDVTSKKGTFELKNLPPGTYTIEAWQEKYGTQDQSVTPAAEEAKIHFIRIQGRAQLSSSPGRCGYARLGI